MTTEEVNGGESRARKAATKAMAKAQAALNTAFKEYQRALVAECVADDSHIDAGDAGTFLEWAKDKLP